MERRRFVSLAASAAAAGATGCLGGGDDVGDGDGGPQETAEFGYGTWVPSGDYRAVGYADLASARGLTGLSVDGGERGFVGDAAVPYTDVDALITTGGARVFEAYAGSFEASYIVDDAFPDAETSEHAGYTVASGDVGGEAVEVAVSDSEVVVSRGGEGATPVVDAAVGDAPRQADEGDIISGLSEYADEPLAVVFDFGDGNAAYQFAEERDGGVAFVEVAVLPSEEDVENTIEEDYSYSDGRLEDLNMTVEGDGRRLVVETVHPLSSDIVGDRFLGSGGLLP